MKNVYTNRESDSTDPLKLDNTKSILDSFRYVSGRRYHNLSDVFYFLPNDDKEAHRLNLQHNIFEFVWKSKFSSPVHELLKSGEAKVLDIGCGTGLWILEMAKEYPKSTFIGVDMSPMFPDERNTPSNVHFLQLNLNDGLPFPDGTFDFVFQGCLGNNVIFKQWEFYAKEMIRVAKPGGWLEFFELDVDYQESGPKFKKLVELVYTWLEAKGINPRPETYVPRLLTNCQDLSKVHFKEQDVPIGNWGDQLGVTMVTYYLMTFNAVKLLLLSDWGINEEVYESIIHEVASELEEFKVYTKSFRWYSQKN